MQKQNTRHTKRIKNLILMLSLAAMLLAGTTVAWFIGTRTVNVASFEVRIASTDSLALSLDGISFSDTIVINEEIAKNAYTNNTNYWDDKGLKPLSTVGEMELASSRMLMYEKASMTMTPGGYRLMASRIDNSVDETAGYVVFDLFIKNYTGRQYITEHNILDEEAIYLTTDSKVEVSENGGTIGTGIENSVRVAFTQIGRVKGDVDYSSTPTVVQGITCSTSGAVTGICREATIWEPNDTSHVASALNYYNKSCKKRIAADLTLTASYSGACPTLTDGTAYPTYAVASPIASTDRLDVYDGTAYNGYTTNVAVYDKDTQSYAEGYEDMKIRDFQYFTDTQKDLEGTARPSFMFLAPNSITKVRIYIYIEGQDIDNYEFAAMGKKVTINFGFTKERFEPGDIEYSGPPIISLIGPSRVEYKVGETYKELGVSAYGVNGADTTGSLTVTDDSETELSVDVEGKFDTAGTYTITYTTTDNNSRTATVERTVVVTE